MEIEFTPEDITELKDNEVFVFGSNLKGRHGAGAAKTAVDNFGAVYGFGDGFYGQTYAIPTKGLHMEVLPLSDIEDYIKCFIDFALENTDKKFYVTKIGCGYAGYTPKDIAPLFFDSFIPDNVILPKEFWEIGCGW